MYSDSEGMVAVRDMVELVLNAENGTQPSQAAVERGERVVPDTDVTEKEPMYMLVTKAMQVALPKDPHWIAEKPQATFGSPGAM